MPSAFCSGRFLEKNKKHAHRHLTREELSVEAKKLVLGSTDVHVGMRDPNPNSAAQSMLPYDISI